MLSKIDSYEDYEDNKGLFTFYRQQAEKQEEMLKLKREKKLLKMLDENGKKKKDESKDIDGTSKQYDKHQDSRPKELYTERVSRNLHEPKNPRPKILKQQFGAAVVIINSKNGSEKPEKDIVPQRSKTTLRRIQEMIGSNNSQYFLQNKQLPSSISKFSLQRTIINSTGKHKIKPRKSAVKQNYFNRYTNHENQGKVISVLSYERLPEILRKKILVSERMLPSRKIKSKRIDTALKCNNSDLIKQIRDSMKEESILDKVSYIDVNQGMTLFNQSHHLSQHKNKSINQSETIYDQDSESRLNSRLDAKQKQLIEIIRNSSNIRKKQNL